MRLIDADELINQGYEIVVDGWQYDSCNKSIDIDDIPTAYDIDKVVEELNKIKKYNLNLADMMLDIQSNGTNRHFICLEDAIKIVKVGGENERSI